MRLLNVHTRKFEDFPTGGYEAGKPSYIILSHRWLWREEVSYQDYNLVLDAQEPDALPREVRKAQDITFRAGWTKIQRFCDVVKQGHNEQFVWIDTCCINKESSAELQESINSMFAWYANATLCYVLLGDVSVTQPWESIGQSEWFKRGWTLQEFLAPCRLIFVDRDWKVITQLSRRQRFRPSLPPSLFEELEWDDDDNEPRSGFETTWDQIAEWAGVAGSFGKRRGITEENHPSVAQVFSWAASRQTTRPEDVAYSLLGLLGINMPLLYGEGTKAFRRLQEEIIRQSNDETIFAWTVNCSSNCIHLSSDSDKPQPSQWESPETVQKASLRHLDLSASVASFLAPDVMCFRDCGDIVRLYSFVYKLGYSLTNVAVDIEREIQEINTGNENDAYYLLDLRCAKYSGDVRSKCSLLIASHLFKNNPLISAPMGTRVHVIQRKLSCTHFARKDVEQLRWEGSPKLGERKLVRLFLPV